MAIWHGEKGRKVTGGKIILARKKKKRELGRFPIYPKIGKEIRKVVRTKGGGKKIKTFSIEFANVLDKKTNQMKKVKILDVLETRGNPQLARSGIVIKGAIIKTEIGKAKVTSKPSQNGVVNAVLIE
jgi:small subunit ribosomal protein S8e